MAVHDAFVIRNRMFVNLFIGDCNALTKYTRYIFEDLSEILWS